MELSSLGTYENIIDLRYVILRTITKRDVSGAGGKDQQERVATISRFKDGSADVMCATDIAGKGLDFDGAHLFPCMHPQNTTKRIKICYFYYVICSHRH